MGACSNNQKKLRKRFGRISAYALENRGEIDRFETKNICRFMRMSGLTIPDG